MTTYFANLDPIDISAIEIMGVNVKTSESPIGYFGTGLKFAIATLLRHGATVTLARPDGLWRFAVRPTEIRGKVFSRVVLYTPGDGAPRELGFTTDLGRNWELWQAFRELESNCRDEGGVSSAGEAPPEAPDAPWGTCFAIESFAFEQIWRGREKIFLPAWRKPIAESDEVAIYERMPSESQDSVFYRGVLAGKFPQPSAFLYNMKLESALTEDRTLQSLWSVAYFSAKAFGRARDERVLERALLPAKGTWERDALMNWSHAVKSPEFDAFVRERKGDARLNRAVLQDWMERQVDGAGEWPIAERSESMRIAGERAFEILSRLGVRMEWGDFTITESLGENIYGLAKGGKIFIAKRTFEVGARFLASTLYEEYIHAKLGLMDETRSMQNFLFEKIFALIDPEEGRAGLGMTLDEALRARQIMDEAPREIDDEIPF